MQNDQSPPPAGDERQTHRFENEQVWPRAWHLICRVDQVSEVGDFVEYRLPDRSAFVIRTPDGLRAFVNSCTHRKARIVDGEGYCRFAYLTCPFHGWQWHLDGTIKHVVQQHLVNDRNRPQSTLDLQPCLIEVFGDWVFFNFDLAASPLSETQGLRLVGDPAESTLRGRLETELSVEAEVPWQAAMQVLADRLLDPSHSAVPSGLDQPFEQLLERLNRLSVSEEPAPMVRGANFVGVVSAGSRVTMRVIPADVRRCVAELWVETMETDDAA